MAASLADVLGAPRALIGMVHLLPLPGSPRWGGSMAEVAERALADARALEAGGLHALLVENHGDAPFTAGRVDAFAPGCGARHDAQTTPRPGS